MVRGDIQKLRSEIKQSSRTSQLYYREDKIKLGKNVSKSGPNGALESCTLENNSYVGMGASVLNGARIESHAVVAAGAVILENTKVPSNQVHVVLNHSIT